MENSDSWPIFTTLYFLCNLWIGPIIRKDFLYRINRIYYWRLFCTMHEHYNYLQLKQSLIKWKLLTKDIKVMSLIKRGLLIESPSLRWLNFICCFQIKYCFWYNKLQCYIKVGWTSTNLLDFISYAKNEVLWIRTLFSCFTAA